MKGVPFETRAVGLDLEVIPETMPRTVLDLIAVRTSLELQGIDPGRCFVAVSDDALFSIREEVPYQCFKRGQGWRPYQVAQVFGLAVERR